MELRSVGAWPISNTWYRPFLRAGTCGLFFLKGDALVLLRMVMLLRDLHYDHLDRLEGHRTASLQRRGCCATCQIITETAPIVHGAELVVQSLRSHSQVSCHLYLGATPSVQAIVHQMGTFLIHLCSKLQCYQSYCMAGRCCPYCAIRRAELSYISGIARLRKTECVNNCDSSQVAIHGTISRCQRVGHQVYSIPWPPSCPGALPTRCTI